MNDGPVSFIVFLCGMIAIGIVLALLYLSNKRCNEDGGVLVRGVIGFECVHEVHK